MARNFMKHQNQLVPVIAGSKGGKGGGGGASEDPNSLFSTDIVFITNGLGEGPLYRINPNGPQDIEIQDNTIDDLLDLNTNTTDGEKFVTLSSTGTTTQDRLDVFGESIVTPQNFASPVSLKKGNLAGVPSVKVSDQETSAQAWDALKFNFALQGLVKREDNGNVKQHSLTIQITLKNRLLTGNPLTDNITTVTKTITGKTDTLFKFSVKVNIPSASRNDAGYRFTIEKTSNESEKSGIIDNIQSTGWFEIENAAQSYPRTAVIGYALKAVDEHQNGIPNFTSLVKGLLVKVPSNYNQPILTNGEIDWREVEVAGSGAGGIGQGYSLQNTGTGVKLTNSDPQIYVGSWDGTFIYSWTQNPVWVIYDILTNNTYGLGVPEDHIDKYKFYQVAQYCDACDAVTGKFVGVDALADGSFRHKPRGLFTSIRENQIGLPSGTAIKQRRFTTDISIADESQAMDLLNEITSTFRAALVYSLGKLTLAVDMPDEFPVAVFNETNIKAGSLTITGIKESEVISGVDVAYVDPTNHYKRETVRVDTSDANDGIEKNVIRNITSLDLKGVTRRSQALRFAQYQIASSKYQRRSVSFVTSTDALQLTPGDIISVAQQQSGIAYGYSGKIHADSAISVSGNANIFLEHFTSPSMISSLFTSNSGPLALRVIKVKDDRVDLYLLSNTKFSLSKTDNVSTGSDIIELNAISKFNKQSKNFSTLNQFDSVVAPEKGDLWSFGEIENPGNFYTSKAGKLFKITGIDRQPKEEEVTVSAIEYISNVYIDSDTFIDYTPTAYTDIISPLAVPPAPYFNFTAQPRRRLDGTIAVDGVLDFRNELLGYNQDLRTEYFLSKPDGSTLVNNVYAGSLNIVASDPTVLTANSTAVLAGKNGFQSTIGEIRLLANAVTTVDTAGGTIDGNVELTLEGLNVAFDENFFKHVLEVNDGGVFSNLKGTDTVSIPIKEKASPQGLLNFVGFATDITALSVNVTSFDKSVNTLKFENTLTNGRNLADLLPAAPFYITLNQLLDSRFFNNNSFYVSGSEFTYKTEGNLVASGDTHINLEVSPRSPEFVKLFVDGIEKNPGQFSVNLNKNLTRDANIVYTSQAGDTEFSAEVEHYTVPIIEVGDNVQTNFNNTFTVINTSYDPASAKYNAALTANSIFRVELLTTPTSNLTGFTFVNIESDPVGTIANVSGNACTLDYNETSFPSTFNLGNNRVYDLTVGGEFEKFFVGQDQVIKDLPIGTTSIRARNKNVLGRFSPSTTKSVTVSAIPIQKVTNFIITESLYREQTGGVAVRATCSFDHITGQEVTDYEISYRLAAIDDVGSQDGGADLTSFNTVKVPSTGIDDDGKIRFTVQGINRGTSSGVNSITFRVTPLNKTIRGKTASLSKTIIGKTTAPTNVFNFTGGQQTDQITLLWTYPRADSGDLLDLDLKEVVIRRIPASQAFTVENFVAADPLVTVSAGTARKSIPIDTFGEFTYLARARDTSGNFSEDVAGITLTTTRPNRSTVVAAFNEDDPSTQFAGIANKNAGETNYPSFNDSSQGGTVVAGGTQTDNANGSSSGFSAIAGSSSDLLLGDDGVYTTKIRDFGATITGAVLVEILATQSVKTTYNDTHEDLFSGVTDADSPNSNVIKETGFGGIGHVLGFSNTSVVDPRFDSNNQTFMSGGLSGNVFAIWNDGQYTGNVINISGVTKASPAVVTTSGSEHGLVNGNRIIIHNVGGMTELNNKELYVNRVNATSVQLYTDSGRTTALDSTGFGTYTSSGVLDQGDYANSNSYAHIAGVINADHIELGASFFANGTPTGTNALANVTVAGNTFQLINMTQFSDTGSGDTFAGALGAISAQTQIRTTTASNSTLYASTGTNDRAEGDLDISQFVGSSTNEGFVTYQAGSRTFRQFQLKFIVNNSKPNEFDFTIDKFRYTIERDTITFTKTVVYDATTKTVNMSSSGFTTRPVITYTILSQTNPTTDPALVVTTAATSTSLDFQVIKADGSGLYPADSSATIMIQATGV